MIDANTLLTEAIAEMADRVKKQAAERDRLLVALEICAPVVLHCAASGNVRCRAAAIELLKLFPELAKR